MSDCCRNPNVGTSGPYDPSEVRLYGRPATDSVKVDAKDAEKAKAGVNISLRHDHEAICLPIAVGLPWVRFGDPCQGYLKSIGVIYGYAYEGQCYKMPKPLIML